MSAWLWLALACSTEEPGLIDTGSARLAVPRPEMEGVLWRVPTTRRWMAPPAWAWADLPNHLDQLDAAPTDWPTRGDYAQRICSGVDTTRSQWRLRLLSSSGLDWANLVLGCGNPELCTWLDGHAGSASGPLSPGLHAAVSACRGALPEGSEPRLLADHEVDVIAWPWRTERGIDQGIDHEGSLGQLASAVGLRRVAFRAGMPKEGLPQRKRRVALYAWTDGVRLRTLTFPSSERAILTSHVGLLNVVLERQGRSERIGVALEDDEFVVVSAPVEWWEEQAEETGIQWMAPVAYPGWDPTVVPLPDPYDTGFPINVEAPN